MRAVKENGVKKMIMRLFRPYIVVFFRVTHNGLRASSCGLVRFPRSHLATHSFVKMSISSYEEPDCPGYRDLVVCDGDLGKIIFQPG